MLTAFVRPPATSLPDCALTHLERKPIDVELSKRQHREYREKLRVLGAEVRVLPTLDKHPDSCFVEDPALVLPEVAVILRPALESRRGEIDSVARALGEERELLRIEAPATIEGGDILLIDRTLFVGCTARTNPAGREALEEMLRPYGYEVREVETPGCLHLKSGISRIGPRTLLANPGWIDMRPIEAYDIITVDSGEASAANALWTGNAILMPASYPRTAEKLSALGTVVETVGLSEFQKAEGATTCLSLLLKCDEKQGRSH
jgi:dimethylargininase